MARFARLQRPRSEGSLLKSPIAGFYEIRHGDGDEDAAKEGSRVVFNGVAEGFAHHFRRGHLPFWRPLFRSGREARRERDEEGEADRFHRRKLAGRADLGGLKGHGVAVIHRPHAEEREAEQRESDR
jgi:hypothetical protein